MTMRVNAAMCGCRLDKRLAALLICGLAASCQAPPEHSTPSGSNIVGVEPVGQNTSLARALTESAVEAIAAQDYDRALTALQQATMADPLYGPARNDMGLIDYHRDQLYEAAREFQNASRLMPDHAEPLNNLGLTLERAGKLDEAQQAYAQAFAIDPANSIYAGNQARARVRLGEYDQQTRQLLEFLLFHDTRQTWIDWARLTLFRIHSGDATLPANP